MCSALRCALPGRRRSVFIPALLGQFGQRAPRIAVQPDVLQTQGRLREKLPILVDALVTVKQFGYKLVDPSTTPAE